MSFTDYLENEILDHILGGTSYPRPVALFVALSTTTPSDDGTGFTEPTVGSYARVVVPNGSADWPAAVGGSKANANAVQFPTATADWGTITHYALFDHLTAGNNLMIGPMAVPTPIFDTDIPVIAAGDIVVTLD